MIEQKTEQASGETGSLNAGLAASNSSEPQREQMAASVPEISVVESPRIAPDHEAPQADAPKVEVTTKVEAIKAAAPQAEAPRVEAPKVESPKAEAPKVEAARAGAPRSPAKFMLMPAGNPNRHGAGAGSEMKSEPSQRPFGRRRLSAMAAMVVLAVMAGALGGALTAANLPHFAGEAVTGSAALEAAVARIDADILALKASVEHTSQLGLAQYNKTTDHLDKVEKAQAEPLAKLARLSEAVDKLRAAAVAPAPVAAVPATAKEVTGSIAPPAPASAPAAAPKVEVARLPTVEGWRLLDIANGSALIEGRRGMFEVYAGDPVPGLGKVEAIRKQDGHWVVVTSKGLIVGR